MVPYKHNFGQTITTDVEGTAADRAFIAHLQWSAAQAVATDTDGIFDGIEAEDSTADPAGVAVAATPAADEFVAQPPCARNVTVTVAATTPAHVKAAAITVSGKNIAGATITEAFTPTAATPATLTGSKAFAEIVSVAVPAQDGDSVTVDVGWGDKLGLPYKLARSTILAGQTALNNVVESTDPTLAVSATAIESNTIDLSSNLDGHAVDTYLLV